MIIIYGRRRCAKSTLLSLVGSGCHRLSELAARLEKPATHLSHALAFLMELKYVRREIPFGESLRSTKRSLYKINDPFLNFYFTFIVPEKSRIDLGLTEQVIKEVKKKMSQYTSAIWEELCRQSVPIFIEGFEGCTASRLWGKGINGDLLEIDIVAESSDKKSLLIVEAKWTENLDLSRDVSELITKTLNLPFIYKRKIIPILFVKHKPKTTPPGIIVFDPEQVVDAFGKTMTDKEI